MGKDKIFFFFAIRTNKLDFSQENLSEVAVKLYLQLSLRLIVDDSAECKKLVAKCISTILTRLEGTKLENELFDVTLAWLNEQKVSMGRGKRW